MTFVQEPRGRVRGSNVLVLGKKWNRGGKIIVVPLMSSHLHSKGVTILHKLNLLFLLRLNSLFIFIWGQDEISKISNGSQP